MATMLSDNQKLLVYEALLDGKRLALRLYSLSAADVPTPWVPAFAELIRSDLFAFALTARRTLELLKLEKRSLRFRNRQPDLERYLQAEYPNYHYEDNFSEAVNYIIHSNNLTVLHTVIDAERETSRLPYFISETDRRNRGAIHIVSCVMFYINEIYPKGAGMLETSHAAGMTH